eukprot:TRINITY_DN9830_c0_g1_i1.p1 TRINITY_DN9830_c0_g1~~TRINITY_DN9830_c0_g1_i1.p1  ORF type:complete len:567 (+),score=106.44 TRINITY_DN9830_c0_g1_i1:111-1811(+)
MVDEATGASLALGDWWGSLAAPKAHAPAVDDDAPLESPAQIERALTSERNRCEALKVQLDRVAAAEQSAGSLEAELTARLAELKTRRTSLRSAAAAAEAALAQSQRRQSDLTDALRRCPPALPRMPRTSAQGLHVGRPVGLPNRNNDCFWLAALQCLRHTPGFLNALSSALPKGEPRRARGRVPANLAESLAQLYASMSLAEDSGCLQADDDALVYFRDFAMRGLPASDGKQPLVQAERYHQRQQDTHEFLHQLLDYLGGALRDAAACSPRGCSANRTRLDSVEKELTRAAKVNAEHVHEETKRMAQETAYNLLYEYSMIQWAASSTRMKSRMLGSIFEGQRLASISCLHCGRFGASGAEPFTMEELQLGDAMQDGSWLGQLNGLFGASKAQPQRLKLNDLLRQIAESPAPEGYLCPNKSCRQVGVGSRRTRLFRLPSVLMLHVNRAQSDGSRCEAILEFEPTLDLNSLGMVIHFGKPLDRGLEPCSTRYTLFGQTRIAQVFHRGPNARAGHYFVYVLFASTWVRVDDATVSQPVAEAKATPMALEASESNDGSRVVLLFYKRVDA